MLKPSGTTGGLVLKLPWFTLGLFCAAGVRPVVCQSGTHVNVAVGAHALTVPWHPSPLNSGYNPAAEVGTDWPRRPWGPWQSFFALSLRGFQHRWWMTGLSLTPEVGLGRRLAGGLHADVRVGLGYMHFFWRRTTWRAEGGRFQKVPRLGRASVALPLTLSLGYRGSDRRPIQIQPYASVRWTIQGIFLKGIPAMTHLELLGGLRINRGRAVEDGRE